MTSRRSWMLGLALGAAISINYASIAQAQAPRNISYQGQLMENNQPATGQYTITINYYTAGGNAPIHSETFTNATVTNGIFNVILGSSNPFPASMDFTEQYFIGVQVNGALELQPRTAMLSAPYALNANTVNGYSVTGNPIAGQILVLDNNGRVPQSALPAGPNFVAGSNIVIQQDTSTNTYTFSSTGGAGTGITSITTGNGLYGGGSTGDVTIGIAPNSVTSDMIAAGSITGNKLSPILAGEGLYQDILGNLNVGVDGSSIVINNDRLSIGTLGSTNLDSTVQRRITGVATPGSFLTGVNNNGTVTTGALTTDNSLTRSITGNDVQLGINPANSNTFTAPQNFGTVNAQTVSTVDLIATGNVTLGNGTNNNITITAGTGTVNFSGARLQGVGLPTAGTDAVNRDYVTTQMTSQTFGGDVTGTAANLQINPSNPGLGDRLIQGVNSGTSGQIVNSVINDDLTIYGGTINNTIIGATTPSSATFTDVTINGTLNANGSANFGNGTTANTFVFNTNGGSISLSGSRLQGVGNPTLGTDAVNLQTLDSTITANNAAQTLGGDINGGNGNNTINTANPGLGDRLVTGVNSGTTTINDPAIADALTINGGTINNTPIGATTASTGNFTTLNSSQQTMLATSSGDVIIGTAAPVNNGAILEIERAQADRLLTRLYNTGAGGAEVRIIGANGATSSLSFTDADEYVSAINSSDAMGLTINVRDAGDVNSQAGLDGAVAVTIERDRDVVINEDLSVGGPSTNVAALEVTENVTSGTEGVGAYVHTITTGGATRSLGVVVESTSDGTADASRPASNAVLGVAKYSGAQNTTDQIVGVVGKAEPGNGITAIGVVGQATDANGLVNTGVLGIARDGGTLGGSSNVGVIGAANASDAQVISLASTFPTAGVVAYNPSTTGSALLAVAPAAGTGIEVAGGDVSATSAPSAGISTRFADTYVIPVGGTTITVPNALVTQTSTVIVTFEANTGSTPRSYTVQTDSTGSFDVILDTAAAIGDEIHYMIINH